MRRTPLAVAVILLTLLLVAPGARAGDPVAEARERANDAAAELSEAESVLGELDAEIRTLEAKKAEASARLEALRAVVRDTVVQQFIDGGESSDVASYANKNLNEQVRAEALGRYATQGNQEAIDEFVAVSEDLDVATAELQGKLAEQADAIEELEARQAELAAELERLEEVERQRRAEEERRRREAAERRAEQQAAARAVAQVATTEASTTTAGESGAGRSAPSGPIASGEWVCPVQGPVAFTDSWGEPRSGGRSHKGVDMMAQRGTPTVAPVSGRVEHRGSSLGGLSWYVYGDDGHTYYGTHLDSYANEGTGHVAAGTVIGYVGSSGNASASAPHLHFEIHPYGGEAVNPYPTVAKYC